MRRRHLRTLRALFAEPAPADVEWREVEALLLALGAELAEGRGSRVRIRLGSRKAIVHRPHPEPTLGRGAVRSIRRFLEEAGVEAR